MIDIDNEKLLTLARATRYLPKGRANKPVHVATLHRWAGPYGVRGVRLETIRIGGIRYTSEEALTRFISRCSSDEPTVLPAEPSKRHQRQIDKAERELAEAGI